MLYHLDRDLDRIRAELPITQHRHFFNTGWAGPEPRASIGAQAEMIAWLNTTGISHHAMPRVRAQTERVRAKAAAYVGASPDAMVLTRGVVDGMNCVLHGFDWRPGDHIITTTIEHSGGLVPLYLLRDRYQLTLSIVPVERADHAAERILAACTARTRLILLSHVSYNVGLRLPVAEIADGARARGVRVLVDGAQTVGAIPVDAPALGVDYYAFPGHKWLLGPECTGALYLAPEAVATLHLSHAGYDTVRQFDREGHYTLHEGPQRFEGIDQNPVALAGWEASLDFLAGIGDAAIGARIGMLTARLHAALEGGAGYRVITPPEFTEAAGLLGIVLDDPTRTRGVVAALLERDYVIRHTPEPAILRISVNFFNTTAEVDGLATALRECTAGA